MKFVILTFLLILFVSLFVGILYIYWPGSCNIINTCPSGQICSNGKCITQCNSANPCINGQICYKGQCIPDVTCSSSNLCPSGQVCLDGQCVPKIDTGCSKTNPCPSGQQCVNGKCVNECITTSTIFTLQFTNVPSAVQGSTFLRADGGSLETYSNVTPPLDTTFQFIFQKIGCTDLNPNINYGDRVQLASYDILYAQCGNGTCSLNPPDSFPCKTGSWQTFIVGSAMGKTGQVCFGDQITLTQTVGSKCTMSATTTQGNTQVFCVNGNRKEEVFTILPIN